MRPTPHLHAARRLEEIRLSVVVPVYNEIATIAPLIRRIRECALPALEIVVVDDHSSDGTRDCVSAFHDVRHATPPRSEDPFGCLGDLVSALL